MSEYLLELKDIYIKYGGMEAVRGISLHVKEGDFVAILGANGAGKTSILNAVSGLVKPVKGEIWFNGERIDRLTPPQIAGKNIVQVPEGRRIFPLLTVKENLMIGAYMRKDRRAIQGSMARVFELFPALQERINYKGTRLSGGQQQMLAIGRALMANPRLMLCDEPSLGLSPLFCKIVAKQLTALHGEGITLILVEQNARMGLGLANYGYVLENGELFKEGSSSELSQDDEVKKAYLGV
jgi:branched-chain amino acid transport system ATP-binding protein